MVLIFSPLNRKRTGEGGEAIRCKQPHPVAFATFCVEMVLPVRSVACQLKAQCFTSHPPTPMTTDSCRQRRSLFLPSSSVSPARIIILHLWHHHELQWGGWDVTNRGFCHKLGILAPEWAREKRNSKNCLLRQSFCLCKPLKTWQKAELLSKHTHTPQKTYESQYKDTVVIKTNGQKRDANELMLRLCIS